MIYGDAAVCDFKSWPGGRGKGDGSPGDWKALLSCYGFATDAEALAYQGNPIDVLAPLAKANVALIHVVGDADDVVPPAENTAIIESRYKKLGGTIQVIHKPGVGHHPHGLDDPTPVVDFILKHTGIILRAETATIHPERDNTMLLNPGKGWVQYYGTDKYTDDYISVGYTRWPWADIEPKEGRFNWKAIDDFIRLFQGHAKKAAFGVMNVSTGLGQYVTPKWVFDAGAVPLGVSDNSSPTGRQMIPKTWDDPVFLKKFKTFVQALGRRYDGHPELAFIDIRSYGNWGEGHTGMLDAPGIVLTPPENLKNNYFLPYFKAFPHTQLIVPWGSNFYDAVYDWAVNQGAGMRRDGILSKWSKDGRECLLRRWPSPVGVRVLRWLRRNEEERLVEAGYAQKRLFPRWEAQLYAVEPADLRREPRILLEPRQLRRLPLRSPGGGSAQVHSVVGTGPRPMEVAERRCRPSLPAVPRRHSACWTAITRLCKSSGLPSAIRRLAPGTATTESLDVRLGAFPPAPIKLPLGSS